MFSKNDSHLPLPHVGTILPECHPCVGDALGILVTAATNRQVEAQDRGQLDVVHALVVLRL
eukprot:5357143-Lingulodinium_polyedra.AAC.1